MSKIRTVRYPGFEKSEIFGIVGIIVTIVVFGVLVAMLFRDNVGGRHNQFKNDCQAKGGTVFESVNNLDCVFDNGARISYYHD